MSNIKSFDEFNEKKKWIDDAIENPGSLRKQLKKKKSDKITASEIDKELKKLIAKDKNKDKPGTQLGKRDSKKKRRLELAKTLGKMNESIESDFNRVDYWINYLENLEIDNNITVAILDEMRDYRDSLEF